MRTRTTIIAAAAAIGLLAGCGSNPPQFRGTVIEKDHDRGTCSTTSKPRPFAGNRLVLATPDATRGGGGGGGGRGGGGSSSGGARSGPSMSKPGSAPKPAPKPAPPANSRPKGAPAPAPVMVPDPISGKPCKRDSYELEVRAENGDEVEIDVSKAEFDRYRTGDRYPK